jgi:3-isopropylmalate/(R)-2-methylmalate dehydratase small subunit
VDLERGVVSVDGREVAFHIDEDARYRLLNGLDEIGITLQSEGAIDDFERTRERSGPVTTSL